MGFDITKSRITCTADLIGITVAILAIKSIEFDPGSKRTLVPGARRRPLYVAIGASSPKFKIEWTDASAYKRMWQACGGQAIGSGPCTLGCNLFDIASGLFEPWAFLGIVLPEPGFKTDDSGHQTSTEFLPTDAWVDGATIYQDAA